LRKVEVIVAETRAKRQKITESNDMVKTLKAGTLSVATAFPNPPWDVYDSKTGATGGFDVELASAICEQMNLTYQQVQYKGENFNNIFDGLTNGSYDAVISGTTITPERSQVVLFSKPYLEFSQTIAVNRQKAPKVSWITDFQGLVAGIQKGNTSDYVAKRLLEKGILSDIKYYSYHQIDALIEDLRTGKIDLTIKLFPVLSWLIKDKPELSLVMEVPTHEKIAIAYAKDNQALCDAVEKAIDALKRNGTFAALQRKWFPQSLLHWQVDVRE
jgi:polar amino acid transport system substrate-binding protein